MYSNVLNETPALAHRLPLGQDVHGIEPIWEEEALNLLVLENKDSGVDSTSC